MDKQAHAVQMFPQMFQGLGKLEGEYEIKLRPDSKSFAILVPRCIVGTFRAEMERMERLSVIAKVEVCRNGSCIQT